MTSFAIIAGSAITNTGPTVINGNIALSPGTSVTGFPPGVVVAPYSLHQTDGVASLAQSDLTTAYNILAGSPATADLTGQGLGGLTLAPGVYNYATAAQLTGTLTLDGRGNPNAVFIINIGTTLTTGTAASVALINGAQGANVYFRVGSSATLGAATMFAGKIVALSSITLVTGASIACGAALARNGAVTLDTNTISICPVAVVTPPTGTTTTTGTGTTGGSAAGTAAGTTVLPGSTVEGTTGDTTTVVTLQPGYVASLGLSPALNQAAVGGAIDRFAARGNVVPLTFQVLRGVFSARALGGAFTQLSGEAETGIAPTGIEAMNSFMALIFDAADDEPEDIPAAVQPPPQALPGTVHALGYAEEEERPAVGPFGWLDGRSPPVVPTRNPWSVWAAGYGGATTADGNTLVGSHERASNTYGFATGANYRVTPDTRIGFALAGGGTNYGLGDGLGGGRGDLFQAAVYSRTNFGAAYVTSAVAFAWNGISIGRNLTIGGLDRLNASFSAYDVAGTVEAGYRMGWLIPYAALGVQGFYTPAFTESSPNGPSIFALSAAKETTLTARTQLGFRINQVISVYDDATLRFRARMAWAHDTATDPRIDLAFVAMPGSDFFIYGASRAADSLLFSGGPEMRFRNGLSVAAAFEGQVSDGYRAFYGGGQLRYRW